jgi:cell division inhibitor SepF
MSFINVALRFFGFSETDEDTPASSAEMIHSVAKDTPNIHPIHTHKTAPAEIRIACPKVYEDSINIATHLQQHRAVIVNLQSLDPSTSKRLIDFLCGTAYAMNGNMKKINDYLFIFSPQQILIEMAENISDIEKATQEYESYKIETISGT